MKKNQLTHQSQSGAALVISLIILLVMTIIGIQGMQGTTLEEKMSGNFRDRAIAFEAAEAGLAAAEDYLNLLSDRPDPASTSEIWSYGALDFSDESTWNNAIENSVGIPTNDQLWDTAPRYFIEERGLITSSGSDKYAEDGANTEGNNDVAEVWGYRITAMGVGRSANAQVVLQANYEKVYD